VSIAIYVAVLVIICLGAFRHESRETILIFWMLGAALLVLRLILAAYSQR
jgi:hypothetical protein